MAVHSMVAKTALLTQTTQLTTGTLFSGTILSPMLFLITTAMTQQHHQLPLEQFRNTTGSCLLAGHLTTVAMIGTSIQMEILFPTDLISIKMPMACPIGGTKTKVTTECSIPMTSRWVEPSICLNAVGLQETSVEALFVDTAMLFLTTCHSME